MHTGGVQGGGFIFDAPKQETSMATIKGTNYSDSIYGTAGNDVIYGLAGDDYINGGAGNDTIYGGAGNDDIFGGAGVNDLWGGTGADWFIMSSRTNAASDDWIGDFTFDEDRIDVSAWGISDLSQVRALMTTDSTGSATLNAFYNGYNHFLTVADVLAGELIASDFVFSNSGAKNVAGTAYADTLFGSRFGDTISGGGGNDQLFGGLGNDTLKGGAGNDELFGGAGRDTMTGGSGFDTFVFDFTSESGITAATRDRIVDFQEDVDLIDLSGIDARTDLAGNQAFKWVGGGAFTAPGQLRYFYSGADTIVSANTDFNSTPEFEVVLSGHHLLIADDFVL